MASLRLRGVAETLASANLCAAQLPLIQEADRLAAAGDVRGAVVGYAAAARSGCGSAMLDAAVSNAVARTGPGWGWFVGAAVAALGTGFLIGRMSKRGRR